jgi:hypothetical protein
MVATNIKYLSAYVLFDGIAATPQTTTSNEPMNPTF